MEYAKLLSCTLTIGEKMLRSGAEISRVEDSIVRICTAYGAERVDVFAITSSIVVSVDWEGKTYTQTRRIRNYRTDLFMLDKLNSLSRELCAEKPDIDEVTRKTELASKKTGYPFPVRAAAWALTAGSFTVFFGGSFTDGLFSAIIGALLMLCVDFVDRCRINKFFANIINSLFVTMLAYGSFLTGLATSCDKIIIGNIMLLIPGLALTNSLRDIIGGDTNSGILRFCEACLVAAGIAVGYILAVFITGGALHG